jgi:hypothetical protein
VGLREVEATHASAAQHREVAAHAERRTEVAGERPHVGAARADDPHVDVDDVTDAAHLAELEGLDRDGSCGKLDVLTCADAGVGPLAVDLDRGDRRGHLLDRPGERCHGGTDRGRFEMTGW